MLTDEHFSSPYSTCLETMSNNSTIVFYTYKYILVLVHVYLTYCKIQVLC